MIRFSAANAESEAAALDLLDATPMSGQVRLAIRRPKGLMASLRPEGRRRDVLVARRDNGSDVLGVGIRSEKECFVDGGTEPETVGYLSALRLREDVRRGSVLARGYQALHELHKSGRARYYLTSILSTNAEAMRLLTSGRAGLPLYTDWGDIHTFLMNPRQPLRSESSNTLPITGLRTDEIPSLVGFLNATGRRRQFFPCYRPDDVGSADGLLPGLEASDVFVARDERGIAGCIALWNQTDAKAWQIDGYGFPAKVLRPMQNVWARWRSAPAWPKAGQRMNLRSLALFVVREDDREVARRLLNRALRAAADQKAELVLWSLHASDPLVDATRRLRTGRLQSRLFLVHWPQDGGAAALPDRNRVPYLETGAL